MNLRIKKLRKWIIIFELRKFAKEIHKIRDKSRVLKKSFLNNKKNIFRTISGQKCVVEH